MLHAVALLAPALIAVGFYNHLHRGRLLPRQLIFAYGLFSVYINLCLYLISYYVLRIDTLMFDDHTFILYVLGATVVAYILPFVVRLIETVISIEVTPHDSKTS